MRHGFRGQYPRGQARDSARPLPVSWRKAVVVPAACRCVRIQFINDNCGFWSSRLMLSRNLSVKENPHQVMVGLMSSHHTETCWWFEVTLETHIHQLNHSEAYMKFSWLSYPAEIAYRSSPDGAGVRMNQRREWALIAAALMEICIQSDRRGCCCRLT